MNEDIASTSPSLSSSCIITITRDKVNKGADDVGLTFDFDATQQRLIITSVAPHSLFADTELKPGMYLVSFNGMETSDEFMANRINSLLARLVGNVTLQVALPPPVVVTRQKSTPHSPVGVHLVDDNNTSQPSHVVVAYIDADSIFADALELHVGMQLVSLNGIQLINDDDDDDGTATAEKVEKWMNQCLCTVTLVAIWPGHDNHVTLLPSMPSAAITSTVPPAASSASSSTALSVAAEPCEFSFLSAAQIMQLDSLADNKEIVPVRRNIQQEDAALLYIFVSHAHADASGKQLATLKALIRAMQQLVLMLLHDNTNNNPSQQQQLLDKDEEWSRDIQQLQEGQPQAAALVARMQTKAAAQPALQALLDDNHAAAAATAILEHVYFWYHGASCLSQRNNCSTKHDRDKLAYTLSHYHVLVQSCDAFLCLRIPHDNHDQRAWCALEQYLYHHSNNTGVVKDNDIMYNDVPMIVVDCTKLLRGERFDWGLITPSSTDDDQDAAATPIVLPAAAGQLSQAARNALMQKLMQQQKQQQLELRRARLVAQETQHVQLRLAQTKWVEIFQTRTDGRPSRVPDMIQHAYQLRRAVTQAEPQPLLQSAMEQLARDLFQVLYVSSCRDAAQWQGITTVQADWNACIEGVGIQCGLHHHPAGATQQQTQRLLKLLQETPSDLFFQPEDRGNSAVLCNAGHRLVPNVNCTRSSCDNIHCKLPKRSIPHGMVCVGCVICNVDYCYTCAMERVGVAPNSENATTSQEALDEILSAYNAVYSRVAESSNNPVLCERRVTLDLYKLATEVLCRIGLKCTHNEDVAFVGLLALRHFLNEGSTPSEQNEQRISSGMLSHLCGVLDESVEKLSAALAEGVEVSCLTATVTIRAPRWVLLDLSNASSSGNANINVDYPISICGNKAQEYLAQNPGSVTCVLGAADASPPVPIQFCEFDKDCKCIWSQCLHRAKQMILNCPVMAHGHSTLDSWSVAKLPLPLAMVGCAVAWNQIFVVGGATGDWVNETKTYSGLSGKTYVGTPDFKDQNNWKDLKADLITPRYHHGCCVIHDEDGQPSMIAISGGIDGNNNVLSSMELLSFEHMKDGWQEALSLPIARKSHLMFCVGGCLFVLAGKAANEDVISEVHMYNMFNGSWLDGPWMEGPALEGPYRPLEAVLVLNRYIVTVGGASTDNILTDNVRILDTKPWVEWSFNGDPVQTPRTTWVPGPKFPHPVTLSNLCVIPSESMQNGDEWILSVGTHATGNVITGFPVKPSANGDLDWSSFQWRKIGSTPDVITFCRCCVVDGTLATIGGEQLSTSKMLDLVHHRRLNLDAEEGMPPIRGVTSIEQQGINFFFHPTCNCMALNDLSLLGRLGFPITEESLFSPGGLIKKLQIFRPHEEKGIPLQADLHCQRCLMITKSIEAARSNKNACHFAICSDTPGLHIPLCSACICALYYD